MTASGHSSPDTFVVSVGAATPLGRSAAASAAAIRGGISGFVDHPFMVDRRGDPFVVAMAPYLKPEIRGESRILKLARLAAEEALAAVGGTVPAPVDMTIMLGLPEHRPGVPATLAAQLEATLSQALSSSFRVSGVQLIPNGHSSGLMAIETACRELREGGAKFVLVGGVDSYVDVDTLEWLDQSERLHVPTNAWGAIPGEAAGFCLLCSAETAAHYNWAVMGKVIATATAYERNRIYTETVCIGEGLTNAVRHVLASLPPGTMIDATICDQNGEAYRADEYGFTLARTSEHFANPAEFLAPADCWGDVGAASGPLFAILAIFATLKGYAKGPRTLLWTSSDGGDRSAVLLETPVQT